MKIKVILLICLTAILFSVLFGCVSAAPEYYVRGVINGIPFDYTAIVQAKVDGLSTFVAASNNSEVSTDTIVLGFAKSGIFNYNPDTSRDFIVTFAKNYTLTTDSKLYVMPRTGEEYELDVVGYDGTTDGSIFYGTFQGVFYSEEESATSDGMGTFRVRIDSNQTDFLDRCLATFVGR